MKNLLAILIYNAIMDDGMLEYENQNLEWSEIDIVGNPSNEREKSTIYIKGNNGGKDYWITVEEV